MSSRRVALNVEGRVERAYGGGTGGKPLRVIVLPYMVKKVRIGREHPTLIGQTLSSRGGRRSNASVHIIHRVAIVSYTLCSVLERVGCCGRCCCLGTCI